MATVTAARMQELADKYIPAGARERGLAAVPIREIWDVEVVYQNKRGGPSSGWHFLIPLSICPTKEEAITFPTRAGYILDPKYYHISAVQSAEIVNIPDAPTDEPIAVPAPTAVTFAESL